MFDGISALLVAGTSFVLSAALTDLVRRVCLRWRILDEPTGQRWHRAPRSRLGGVAIFAAVVICIAVFTAHPLPRSAWGLLIGAAFVFTWGLVDDLWPLPSGVKLLLLAMTG